MKQSNPRQINLRIAASRALAFLIIVGSLSWCYMEKPGSYLDNRDGEEYPLVELGELIWFQQNLRFRSHSPEDTLIEAGACGVFYSSELAKKVCPQGWRLPTEKEVKDLVRMDRKGKIDLIDTLRIELCGRIDYEKHSKHGLQNTFWLDEDLHDGFVMHWHSYPDKHELHDHNVVNARRKFPVRCVCEVE